MKLSKLLLMFATILFITCQVNAQDTTNFFPHHKGDIWEYLFTDGGYDTVQVLQTVDSTDSNGISYLTDVARSINPIAPPVMLDSITNYRINLKHEVYTDYYTSGIYFKNPLIYKLDAKLGEKWSIDTSQFNGEMCRVGTIDTVIIFGKERLVKNYVYYLAVNDTSDTTGLSRGGVTLAAGLGMIWKGGGDAIGNIYLKGAVINGALYGDTTNVITNIENYKRLILENFKLFQNYPNPFNPSTTISFEISHPSNISLIVYNILGKEISKLIDYKEYSSGIYQVKWDATNGNGDKVSSGIYLYTLIAGGNAITKSMIYLK